MKTLKGVFSQIKGVKTAKAATDALSGVKTTSPTVNDLFKQLSEKVTKNEKGFVEINGKTPGEVNSILKKGSLHEFIQLVGDKTKTVDNIQASNFENLVGLTPEKQMFQIEQFATQAKLAHPNLDIKLDQILSQNLLTNTKLIDQLARIEKKASFWGSKKAKAGYLGLTIGSFILVPNILKNLRYRKGCFMLTKLHGVISSCKVESYTCGQKPVETLTETGEEMCPRSKLDGHYNVTLALIAIVNLANNEKIKNDLATFLDYDATTLKDNVGNIIKDKYALLTDFVENTKNKGRVLEVLGSRRVCELSHPQVEDGVIPVCRMCSSTDKETSTTYLDQSLIPDNVSFKCIENPSIADVLGDLMKNTSVEIINTVTSGFAHLLKPIGMILTVIFIAGLIIMAIFKLSQPKYSELDDDEIPLIDSD